MPFDMMPQGKLTLADLAWRLRHPETWPKGFQWDYMECNQCAMGLAWSLSHGGRQSQFDLLTSGQGNITHAVKAELADAKAMSSRQFSAVFWELDAGGWVVRPDHVADAIDRYLKRRDRRVLAKEAVHAV